MRRKKETGLEEVLAMLKYSWRHRQGFNLWGKHYLDNHIPGLILDVFDNLGYEQRDGTKPVLASKRKTDYGWHLVWNLPPGVSYNQIKSDTDFFQDACNGWIELEWLHGKCHMNIQLGELPSYIDYHWEPADHSKLLLPIPIGYSRTNLITLDLPESPHFLIAGATGFGKTSMIMAIIHCLLHTAVVVVIDLKGIVLIKLNSTINYSTNKINT